MAWRVDRRRLDDQVLQLRHRRRPTTARARRRSTARTRRSLATASSTTTPNWAPIRTCIVWDVRSPGSARTRHSAWWPARAAMIWGKIRVTRSSTCATALPTRARLAAPSISARSVPKRIAHGGRLRLKGSISDQGVPIGGPTSGIERYGSGKWSRIKTITTTSPGTYSYYTPKNYSKKQYRVVYDGVIGFSSRPRHATTSRR